MKTERIVISLPLSQKDPTDIPHNSLSNRYPSVITARSRWRPMFDRPSVRWYCLSAGRVLYLCQPQCRQVPFPPRCVVTPLPCIHTLRKSATYPCGIHPSANPAVDGSARFRQTEEAAATGRSVHDTSSGSSPLRRQTTEDIARDARDSAEWVRRHAPQPPPRLRFCGLVAVGGWGYDTTTARRHLVQVFRQI